MSRMLAAGVVLPARDEEDTVEACLHGLRRALDAAAGAGAVRVAVTVVLDRCRDATAERVARALAGWPPGWAEVFEVVPAGGHRRALTPGGPVAVAGAGVGALRDLGVRRTLARLGDHPLDRVWLLHTDADTVVPAGWVVDHLALAAAGARGVAGLADLDEAAAPLEAAVRERYDAVVAAGVGAGGHRHVYGANLGVRADTYLAAGGFPGDGAGEDRALWERLEDSGVPLARPLDLRVRTSARRQGRAGGGLADLLRSLEEAERPTRRRGA